MSQPTTTPPRGDHVAIIGGGVIGAMCAWYLTREGYRVTIIDRARFGGACSHGNCGFICPSSVLPLAQPGAISRTVRAMMKRDSPFAIKPQLSRDFVSWFWHFYRQSNRKSMLEVASAKHALLQSSMRLYRDLIEVENISCEWQEQGLLYVFDDAEAFDAYGKTDALLREHFGVAATPYPGDAVIELEPAIKPGFGGGWHYEDDCHIRPDKLLTALRERLLGDGVSFMESTNVDGFVRHGSSAKAVTCGDGTIDADHFVVATGAMTPLLNEHIGFRIPIQPGKGYSITMPPPAGMPIHPIIFDESHVAITPMQTGYRIGSTMEFVGYDTSISRKRLALLTSAAEKYLIDPLCEPVQEEWYGWRPITWDDKPVIDRSPAMDNVWVAVGHSMLGVSMAPATGRLIADLVSGSPPHLDPAPFSAARFQRP